MLIELHIQISKVPTVWCDNFSTAYLSANLVLHSKAKYIKLDLYFVREKVEAKQHDVQHITSSEQTADILTTGLISKFP